MFKPVSMTRLRLLVLERDERAVLRHLGRAGVLQLTHTPAGPDTAPLSPRNRAEELARLERMSSRLENLRRSLELPAAAGQHKPAERSLDQVERNLRSLEEQSGPLLQQRQRLQQRLTETAAVGGQIADYRGLDLPLDPPDESAFLHFVTGSLPAKNFTKLEMGADVAVLPLLERDGRQMLIALTTRPNRPALDRALQQAGFQPEKLPVVAGTTTAALSAQNQREQDLAAAELKTVDTKLQALRETFSPEFSEMETTTAMERRLLEAEQNFPRTENAVLVTGWIPSADVLELEPRIQEITGGRCLIETTPAENLLVGSSRREEAPTENQMERSEPPYVGCYKEEAIPVLLRQPRWLRPFAMLVTAYGLPQYRELEPTLFVAVSYLLMFGMMFGDAGHGLVLALGGLILLLASRRTVLRDAGLLLFFAGGASLISGAIYGSYFGLPQFKKYALWHDPLEGDTMGLMIGAVKIGIVMISLGLILNIVNRFRHGDLWGGWLDKFGVAGAVFYWGALMLLTQAAAIRARGLLLPVILLLAVLVLAWLLKEPLQVWRGSRRSAESGGAGAVLTEAFAGTFEGLLSYLANTISFVRLAAYAMSHAALLMAAFVMAGNVRHFSPGGHVLSVLVIILGNAAAIALEGIVASVQALRLEYYEFFGKFFSGGGQAFQPFRLQTNSVADTPR